MRAHLDVPADLRAGFLDAGVVEAEAGGPTVIGVPGPLSDWPATLDALTNVFTKAKAAAVSGSPIVFVVSSDALLGRTGEPDAMAANGVVSAARTLAAELRKPGVPVNCVARSATTPDDAVVRWVLHLLNGGPDDPTGEVVQLGGAQIGKALS
jgi:NAD(P)-dependent dehydrogenase (short-subunit alcohol dehydrogenase family)